MRTPLVRTLLTAAAMLAPALLPSQSTPVSPVARKAASAPSPRASAHAAPRDSTPVTIILFEEDVLAVALEPDERLADAREALRARDPARAAAKTRQAASFIRLAASTVRGAEHDSLGASARHVDSLATGIESGRVRSVRDFDAALGETQRALAAHHLARAREAWLRRDAHRTGHELQAASAYLERGAAQAGHGTAQVVGGAVREGRRLGGALLHGTGWTVDEVGQGIDAVGKGIERLGSATGGTPR